MSRETLLTDGGGCPWGRYICRRPGHAGCRDEANGKKPLVFLHKPVCVYLRPHNVVCGISVSWPGLKPGPLAVKAWSPDYWTAREFPNLYILFVKQRDLCNPYFLFQGPVRRKHNAKTTASVLASGSLIPVPFNLLLFVLILLYSALNSEKHLEYCLKQASYLWFYTFV